jgi:type II secretory pathway component PulF
MSTLQSRATRALELLRQGAPVAQAARTSGVPLRALQACQRAAPGDAQGVLEALGGLAADVERREREVRSAATWPFVLLVTALVSGVVVWGAALPALSRLPLGGAQISLTPAVVTLMSSMLGLVVLGWVVLRRVSVPGLRAWTSIDRHAFASCTQVLHAAGVPLTDALRAAATWMPLPARAAGEAVARALEAGSREALEESQVLDAVAAGLLLGAAKSGTAPAALSALHATTRVTMEREVPRQVTRLHTVALLLAGAAVGVNFVVFYSTYIHAVTG